MLHWQLCAKFLWDYFSLGLDGQTLFVFKQMFTVLERPNNQLTIIFNGNWILPWWCCKALLYVFKELLHFPPTS